MRTEVQDEERGEDLDDDFAGFVLVGHDHFDEEPDLETDEGEGGDEVDAADENGPSAFLHVGNYNCN